MTEEEARQRHDDFLKELRSHAPLLVPWGETQPVATLDREDHWLFVYRWEVANPEQPYQAVLVRKDRSGVYILHGAIGRVFRECRTQLGLPTSNERWLGSVPGRYQVFEQGLVVWDRGQRPGEDLAYPRFVSKDAMAGRRCMGIVSFIDLRGFTPWSQRNPPSQIQTVISTVETILQEVFASAWCECVFVKGTGDGVMVVSEKDWFRATDSLRTPDDSQQAGDSLRPGHASAWLSACGDFVRRVSTAIPAELAVGCGVDWGQLDRLFLLGQVDYLGVPVNNAAKIQQLAYNEIVISKAFCELLLMEGVQVQGKTVTQLGVRVDPNALEAQVAPH